MTLRTGQLPAEHRGSLVSRVLGLRFRDSEHPPDHFGASFGHAPAPNPRQARLLIFLSGKLC